MKTKYTAQRSCALLNRFWSVEAPLPPLPALLQSKRATDNPFWSVKHDYPHAWIGGEGFLPLALNMPSIAYKPVPAHRAATL